MSDSGLLTRLDLAFSRDQAEKVYVQNRMLENGKELFAWLEDGGHFYVCGDATRMAKDVDRALHQVIATHGGLSAEDASEYVNKLKKDKRYLRDVY
jgi:sulfite reductase (NADPH) flavoprotein alpha-component